MRDKNRGACDGVRRRILILLKKLGAIERESA
jgi:hypothetical protein